MEAVQLGRDWVSFKPFIFEDSVTYADVIGRVKADPQSLSVTLTPDLLLILELLIYNNAYIL